MASKFSIHRVRVLSEPQVYTLAELLIDAVDSDASVSFMHPLHIERALDFWRGVARNLVAEKCALLVAEDGEGVCGTVQLGLSLMENQPHVASLTKLLVHSRARRQGLGNTLMRRAEALALKCDKTLLVLNTPSGEAQRLYESLGWKRAGEIPRFSLSPRGDEWRNSAWYYRDLGATEPG